VSREEVQRRAGDSRKEMMQVNAGSPRMRQLEQELESLYRAGVRG
jgi:hypothetical protein